MKQYEISKARAFWFQIKRFLKVFSIYVYFKHVGPGAGPFLSQGNNLNNLGRGPQSEAMNQISEARAFCFQIRRFLKFFPYMDLCKQVAPGVGPFFTPGL